MEAMIRCYDALMKEMGATRQVVIRTDGSKVENPAAAELAVDTIAAVAYGKYYPEMWIQLPFDQKDATVGNGTHVALQCKSPDEAKRVYQAALAHGATDNGPPGPREEYSDKYYGAFFIDPAGNKMEATYYDIGMWAYCTVM